MDKKGKTGVNTSTSRGYENTQHNGVKDAQVATSGKVKSVLINTAETQTKVAKILSSEK